MLAAQQQKTGGAAKTFGDEHCENTEGRILVFSQKFEYVIWKSETQTWRDSD